MPTPETISFYRSQTGISAVVLSHPIDEVIDEWARLRRALVRRVPEAFSRAEWAYLISFLARESLEQPFLESFGSRVDDEPSLLIQRLFRPRTPIATWLPSNVSLLGPLTLVLLSLIGGEVWLKESSKGSELTRAFIDAVLKLEPRGALARFLRRATVERVARDADAIQQASSTSAARVFFGSDAGAKSVDSLPHPPDAPLFAFVDRRSEAWLQRDAIDEVVVDTLIKVLAVYGQAGCTSPSRVVLIDGDEQGAKELAHTVVERWPKVMPDKPQAHVASQCVMLRQWAAATGWSAFCAADNAAVVAVAPLPVTPWPRGHMLLPIVYGTLSEAVQTVPANLQTIGHALVDATDRRWLRKLAGMSAKRFIPLAQMHQFGPTWDGFAFWRGLFEEVEFRA